MTEPIRSDAPIVQKCMAVPIGVLLWAPDVPFSLVADVVTLPRVLFPKDSKQSDAPDSERFERIVEFPSDAQDRAESFGRSASEAFPEAEVGFDFPDNSDLLRAGQHAEARRPRIQSSIAAPPHRR